MEMHVMAREDVVATLEEAGGMVLDMIAKNRCGPSMREPRLRRRTSGGPGSERSRRPTVPIRGT